MNDISKIATANRIGMQEAYLGVGIALTIDLGFILFSIWDNDYKWLFQNGFFWKLPMAAILMVVVGQVLGKRCARNIIVRNRNWFVNGPLYALMILAVTCFLSGLLALLIDIVIGETNIKEGSPYILGGPIIVMVYSFIPVTIHGLWFGFRIYKKGRRYADT